MISLKCVSKASASFLLSRAVRRPPLPAKASSSPSRRWAHTVKVVLRENVDAKQGKGLAGEVVEVRTKEERERRKRKGTHDPPPITLRCDAVFTIAFTIGVVCFLGRFLI